MRPAFSEKPSGPVQRELLAVNDNRMQVEEPEPGPELYAGPVAFVHAFFLIFIGLSTSAMKMPGARPKSGRAAGRYWLILLNGSRRISTAARREKSTFFKPIHNSMNTEVSIPRRG